MRAGHVTRQLGSVVGRARQQDGCISCAFRRQDYGVQLHPIAHRNHHFAARVVEAFVGRLKLRRRLTGQRLRVGWQAQQHGEDQHRETNK